MLNALYMFLPDAPAKQSECRGKNPLLVGPMFLRARPVGDGAGPVKQQNLINMFFFMFAFLFRKVTPVTPVTSYLEVQDT